MDDFWVLVNMFPSNCWGTTRFNFLPWCQLTEEGSVFQQEHPQFCKPLAHISSLAAHWGRLKTGYLPGKIKVYFLWYTLSPFTAISRISAFPLWVTVWGHCSAVPHQDPPFLLGAVNHPRRSPSILRRTSGAQPGVLPDIGHCSAGVAIIRFICGLSVLWELSSGDTADPSSINKADNTFLHRPGEIKHNRRHFYSLKTTQVPQWQITFDKNLMWCLGIQPGILCKAQ